MRVHRRECDWILGAAACLLVMLVMSVRRHTEGAGQLKWMIWITQRATGIEHQPTLFCCKSPPPPPHTHVSTKQ